MIKQVNRNMDEVEIQFSKSMLDHQEMKERIDRIETSTSWTDEYRGMGRGPTVISLMTPPDDGSEFIMAKSDNDPDLPGLQSDTEPDMPGRVEPR